MCVYLCACVHVCVYGCELGELHLTPLKGIIQLRPSQHHLDHGPVHGAGGTAASDGETTATESEEEEARPITVSERYAWEPLHAFWF